MDRRACLGLLAGAPFALTATARAAVSDDLFRRATIIDGQGVLNDPYAPASQDRFSARALSEIRASGETACCVTVNEVGNAADVWDKTIANIAAIDMSIALNSDIVLKATTAADIRRAKESGRVAVVFDTQDTLIGADLDRITLLKGLGVRTIQLTYNLRNLAGDGCLEPGNAGLSKLGHAIIERVEKERLLLDLSHSGQRTVAEGIAAATRPPVISHTGCRALNDNPRNQGDAELKACADKGGVVGIYWMPYLRADSHPTGADLVRHMEHAVQVCGEDHVGIGTDNMLFKTVIDAAARADARKVYEDRKARGIAAPGEGPDVFQIVEEWDGYMKFHKLADALAAKGWTSARIEKVLGGNLLRLYGEVWGG